MKNKYWVSYKIPNEIKDFEGGFYVYAFNDIDAKYEALKKIKEEFPNIEEAYDDETSFKYDGYNL
jgi:predicted phage-related endonuclease